MKLNALIVALSAAGLLVACGGGGSDAGTSPFGPGSGGSVGGTGTSSGNTDTVTNDAGSLVVSLSSRTLSASSPAVVTALVKDAAGNAVQNAVVTFGLTNGGLASLSSSSGLTNASGEATATLSPKPSAEGAGYVTASVTLSGAGAALTSQYAFSVSPVNVTIDSATAVTSTLTAFASTGINVTVNAASSSVPVTLTASSTCVSQGKAILSPSTITLTTTTGSFTYQDKGCGTTDVVTIGIQGGSQTKTVPITAASPVATGIAFDSATPDELCLMGSGCDATSTVRFRVVDTSGGGISTGTLVKFSLDQPASASLSVTEATTNADGYVEVVVSSKTQPTPVRVTAALDANPAIKTVSNALTILSGLPYQDGITFSAIRYAVNGNLNGDSAKLDVRLTDRFGNPVPDGTVVNFMSEGGSVTPGACSTSGGVCSSNFVVQNPRPVDGRVYVVAYAQGEENFSDINNSNTYDEGEFNPATQDLGEVVVDGNENGLIDSGERVIGVSADGVWTSTAYVRDSFNMIMTNTVSKPRLFVVSGGACTTTPFTAATLSLSSACTADVSVCVRDGNTSGSNPILAGSTLAMSLDVSDANIAIAQARVDETANEPTIHTITASRKTCGTALAADGVGKLTITVNNKPWVFDSIINVAK